MKLFGAHLSPFFERAFIVLDVKGRIGDVESAMVPGGFGSPEHVALNPLAKIPYLQLDNGTVLTEGQVIAEYFDAVFEGENLVPAEPLLAARVHQITRLVDFEIVKGFGPLVGAIIFKRRDDAAIKEALDVQIPRAFDAIEYFMDDKGFMIGDSFTMADAAMIPVWFQLQHLIKTFGPSDFGDRPKLKKWTENMANNAYCQQSHARMGALLQRLMAASNN